MIESVNNDKVKYWTKLNDKKYQKEEGLFLVEGEHLVEEAHKCGILKEVIALNGNEVDYPSITYVSENVMKKITMLTSVPKIIGVVQFIESREISGNVLLLDAIQDPGNLGTIIRSAVAFNVDTIILGKNTVSVYNPKVIRASEGMLFKLNIIESDIASSIINLKNSGYTIYTTDVLNGSELSTIKFNTKNAIIIGNEGAGVSDDIKELCDEKIYIKMNENCESLNVGVATSIILYHLNK